MIRLQQHLANAFTARSDLMASLERERVTAYRLFHGVNEGCPGITIDRYGAQILLQTFHQPLSGEEEQQIHQFYSAHLPYPHFFVYNDRSAAHSRYQNRLAADARAAAEGAVLFQEFGVNYVARGRHKGQDPYLFLDFRAARRHVLANSSGQELLNVFAYTCGIGVCAAVGGARQVVNIDFADSSLAVGAENARLNNIAAPAIQFVKSDFFTAARQLAGLPVAMRRGRQSQAPRYRKMEPRQFDMVVLDPPKWAKSPFGTVDLVRDYASVFKPALLCTKEGGQMLCANNVAQVALSDWLDTLRRTARKVGRSIREVEMIQPEADFPSRDGNFPLKMVLLRV